MKQHLDLLLNIYGKETRIINMNNNATKNELVYVWHANNCNYLVYYNLTYNYFWACGRGTREIYGIKEKGYLLNLDEIIKESESEVMEKIIFNLDIFKNIIMRD